MVQPQAADQLVGERRLARTAGAGDAQHGHFLAGSLFAHGLDHAGIGFVVFEGGDQLRQGAPVHLAVALDGVHGFGGQGAHVFVAAHDHLADHPGQAHFLTIFGAENPHAVLGQGADFGWHDHATAAAEHLDVLATSGFEQFHHVAEVLVVPALIRADGDALRIFLQGCGDHLVHRAVVAQVDDFSPHALQDAPHDVDGGVVAVKQRSGGDKTHLVRGAVFGQGLEFSGQVGHGVSPWAGKLTFTLTSIIASCSALQ